MTKARGCFQMSDIRDDDTAVPLIDDVQFRRLLKGEGWPNDQTQQGFFIQRIAAEMNRRLSRAQIQQLEAQGRQLEAQGRQNEAQLKVAKSVKKATWGLSAATIVLALVTGGLWFATSQSVSEQVMINRPVVMENGADIVETNAGEPSKISIHVFNFGKSAAPTLMTPGHIFVRNQAPLDKSCNEHGSWPTGYTITGLAPGAPFSQEWPLADGENLAEAKQGKTVYVVGCAYYTALDKKSYFSDICMTWNSRDGFQACKEPNRNYVH
jgi:hypothetical protein